LEDNIKMDFYKHDTITWTGLLRFRARQVVGSCVNGNEIPGSLKEENFATS
jgi:hypothetical protein